MGEMLDMLLCSINERLVVLSTSNHGNKKKKKKKYYKSKGLILISQQN